MRRRKLIALLAGAAIASCGSARAQQRRMPVIGFLGLTSPNPTTDAFLKGLGEAGYISGRNVSIEYRWAVGHSERLPGLAAELVGKKVDVIIASGGVVPARIAKEATTTIPIVFEIGVDPVAAGIVASFARPGGNMTGVSILTGELNPKRLELLSELVPRAKSIGLLINPNNAGAEQVIAGVLEAARARKVQMHIEKEVSGAELDTAFASLSQIRPDALLVANDAVFFNRRERIVALAARHAIPAIYEWREFVVVGGLISYGTSISEMYRQAGVYAGRILAGARPIELPVVQPKKFELVINLKTAKALGLIVPLLLLAQADEVIE